VPIGVVGKYERLDVLGHGTSGVVYLAWDTLLRRQVALKEIRVDGVDLERVLDEARVLDRLRHPHIVRVNGVDQIDGMVLIDMELIAGQNLAQFLRAAGGPVPLERAVTIVLAVLDALGYAHERRIVHRDIKPANILIGDDGGIKLTDFGLAEALGTGSVAGGGGTYPYMAPEDFAEDAASDYRSDLWAVGVVLYEMLTGRRPFTVAAGLRNKDPFVWKRAIEREEPVRIGDLRPDLAPGVADVVSRALTKSKASRFPTASAFAVALRAAAATPSRMDTSPAAASGDEREPDEEAAFAFAHGAVVVTTLDDLLAGAAKHWDEARRALLDGRIERFLRAIDEPYIADLAAELSARSSAEGPDRLLREFLNRSRRDDEPVARDERVPALHGAMREAEEPGTIPLAAPFARRSVGEHIPGGRFARARMPGLHDIADAADRAAPGGDGAVTAAVVPAVAAHPPEPARGAPAPCSGQRTGQTSDRTADSAGDRQNAPPAPVSGSPAAATRWWFWPIYLVVIAPVGTALWADANGHVGRTTLWHNLFAAWASAGFLAAMLLLASLATRVQSSARILCGLPLAIGLVSAGALASQMLGPQPGPHALGILAGIAAVPLAVLILEASTVARQWRLWLALIVAGAGALCLHFAKH
jgi:hypothetical protein